MAMDTKPGSPEDVAQLDYINRDPNELNEAGRTLFMDIFGEPEGAHSNECVWRNSYKCFYTGKNCCYTVLTYLCAIPLAFCWGCEFAITTFMHIWYITPCCIIFNLNFSCVSRFFATLIHCCCDPVYEAFALSWTKIYIHTVTNSDAYRTVKMEDLNQMNQV